MDNSSDSNLRFPSGGTPRQVKQDATKLQKADPSLSRPVALDKAAAQHRAMGGYEAGLKQAREYAAHDAQKAPLRGKNVQYCVSRDCGRVATGLDTLSLARCGYHIDPVIDESEVPKFIGSIPEGAVCFESGCAESPIQILGGQCFCNEHYDDRKSGGWLRRRVLD